MKELEEFTPAKRKPLSSWAVMSSVFKNVKPTESEIANINSFFFARYLSNNIHTLPIAVLLNKWYNLPVPMQYRFAKDYSDLVGMAHKVKFISTPRDKKSPDLEQLINNTKRKYKVSHDIAIDYLKLMTSPQRKEIFELYDEGIQKT